MHSDYYVDQLRILGNLGTRLATDRVLEAFRAVPREAFAGTGPWKYRSSFGASPLDVQTTPDADPKWLYNAVLLVLDEAKGINIGDPILWSRVLASVDIEEGSRILQVGAGVGYYTAILAELTGTDGHVLSYEIEGHLADRAAANLADRPNIEIRCGDAVTDSVEEDSFDLVIAFAGVSHVPKQLANRLAPNGRLLLPLTGERGWGAMVLVSEADSGFVGSTLGQCGFYPCKSARDDTASAHVSKLFEDRSNLSGRWIRQCKDGADYRWEALAR